MAVVDSKGPRLHHDNGSRGGDRRVRSTLENMIYITFKTWNLWGSDQISDNETGKWGCATLPWEGLESIEWAKKTG